MSEISLIIHVVFAAILVGPQVLMFFAVTPASWAIEDDDLRTFVVRVIARRFAVLTVIALVVLLATGLFQFYRDDVVPPAIREDLGGFRFGVIFMAKMTLVVVLVGMIAFHASVLSRRMATVTEGVKSGSLERYELDRARRNSLMFSALMILVSLGLVALGVLLAFAPFADEAL
jgi:uncharacterized membrane protein